MFHRLIGTGLVRASRNVGRVLRDSRGSALIEFGVAVPLLAFMIMIIVDSSRGVAAKSRLEAAAARTLEKVSASTGAGSDYSAYRTEAANASGQPVANVTLDTWLECNRVRQSSFNGTCPTGEEMGRYLSIAIRGTYNPLFNAQALAGMYGGTAMGSSVAIEGDAMLRLQ